MGVKKEERETIIVFSEAENEASVYTFNTELKKRFAKFSKQFPELCRLDRTFPDGAVEYLMVIDRIIPHMLRHTYATLLFDAGVDAKSAQKFLGHSDIEVTLEVYTHLSKFKEEKSIQALDEHLKERKKEPEIRLLRAL